jgi:hypothetical protein
VPTSGWIRQQLHPDVTKPWVATGKTVLCPPTVFQPALGSVPVAVTLDQTLKALREYVNKL